MLNKYRGPDDDTFDTVARRLRKYYDAWGKKVAEPRLGPIPLGNGLVTPTTKSTHKRPVIWNNGHYLVNLKVTPTFTGRKGDLAYLEQVISPVADTPNQLNECRIFVMTGISGIGKTELCLKLVQSLRKW